MPKTYDGEEVIIIVEGGVVQGVFSTDPTLKAFVVDHDEEKVEEFSPDEERRRAELVKKTEKMHDIEIRF